MSDQPSVPPHDPLAGLPHRAPFRLVDAVTELVADERAVGYRDVRADEPWMAGHFPDDPILPGVLVIESLAQLAGVFAQDAGLRLLAIDKAKLRRPVRPGERLDLVVTVLQRRESAWRVRGEASVAGARVAEAELLLGS